jgi:prephenate dehydratase
MSHNEGMSFLLQLLDCGSSIPAEELDAASALTHEVGGHPLALELMARMIRGQRSSVARFLAFYTKHQDHLLTRPTPMSSSYHHSLATLWTEAFVRLSERAEQLLWLLSVLDPDGVELELLEAAPMGEIMDFDHFKLVPASSFSILANQTQIG